MTGAAAAERSKEMALDCAWEAGTLARMGWWDDAAERLTEAAWRAGVDVQAVCGQLAAGRSVPDICGQLPAELHEWVEQVADVSVRRTNTVVDAACAEHDRIVAALPAGWARADYASAAERSRLRVWLLMLLDEQDPTGGIWRDLWP